MKIYLLYGYGLWYIQSDPENRMFNCVITEIYVVRRETTRTISDSTETCSPVESEIVRVVSLSATEVNEMTRFKNPIFRVRIP